MNANNRTVVFAVALGIAVAIGAMVNVKGGESRRTAEQENAQTVKERPIVTKGPGEGDKRWVGATGRDDVGEGSVVTVKVDRVAVPYTKMLVATERLAAAGIPVHYHTAEDELIYVVSGRGTAIVGHDHREVKIEPGSVIYVPAGGAHGFRNADAQDRMEILFITTPALEGGLGDFFRNAAGAPGDPPQRPLSPEELAALLNKYGMRLPQQDAAAGGKR